MIVYCGCPWALMGDKEYEKLKRTFKTQKMRIRDDERFRFGPSRTYSSQLKVKIPMKLGDFSFSAEFFVVKGDIPILLGNDFMKPFEGKIDLNGMKLELKKVEKEIPLIETPGGHYIIPVKYLAINDASEETHNRVIEYKDNLLGEEADV